MTKEHLSLEATDVLVTLHYISGGGILSPNMVSFIVASRKTHTERRGRGGTTEMASSVCGLTWFSSNVTPCDLLLTTLLITTPGLDFCPLLHHYPQSNCSRPLGSHAVCVSVFNILYIAHIDPSGTQSVLSKLKECFVGLVRKKEGIY